MFRFIRILLALFIAFSALGFATGCADERPDHIAPMHSSELNQPVNEPTSLADAAEAHARSAAKVVGYSTAWVLNAAGIALVPLIIIFLVPGFLFGRAEKMVEGLLMVVIGGFLMYIADMYHLKDLWTCALLVNLLPGVALFFWGIASGEEKGKLVLVGVPLFGMGLWLLAMCSEMLTKGLVMAPIMTFLIIVAKLALIALIFGGDEERRTARA